MINYEKYAELRDSKGLKDSDIAKITNIPQSTFTAWKKGDYMPKADKMEKIAAALDMEYSEFVGPVGKFSSLNKNRPLPMLSGMEKTSKQRFNDELLRLYHNATPDAQKSVLTLLKNSQKDASKSSKEA
jgi:transcriptional regulator with XRE-family HTH domain